MKVAVFGARGRIGRQIVEEARLRKHNVTAVVRRDVATVWPEGVTAAIGDAVSAASVTELAERNDAVVSAVGPGPNDNPRIVVEAAHALVEGMRRAGPDRLLIVGGAGSLEVAPGVALMDTPQFPAEWKGIAVAHRDALLVYRQARDIDWTYFSPADLIEPGKRTGHYRIGGDQLLTDANGESRISISDFAVAMIDELETHRYSRRRIMVAY